MVNCAQRIPDKNSYQTGFFEYKFFASLSARNLNKSKCVKLFGGAFQWWFCSFYSKFELWLSNVTRFRYKFRTADFISDCWNDLNSKIQCVRLIDIVCFNLYKKRRYWWIRAVSTCVVHWRKKPNCILRLAHITWNRHISWKHEWNIIKWNPQQTQNIMLSTMTQGIL